MPPPAARTDDYYDTFLASVVELTGEDRPALLMNRVGTEIAKD
jgi:hypothetical protein